MESSETGIEMVSVENLQACVLLAVYELRKGISAKTWITTGKAIRLAQMLNLHRIDVNKHSEHASAVSSEVSGTTGELEEQRRTFWAAYILDCFGGIERSISNTIAQSEIKTYLPSQEIEVGDEVTPTKVTVSDAIDSTVSIIVSPFAGVVVMAALCSEFTSHLSKSQDMPQSDLKNNFWVDQRSIGDRLQRQLTWLLGHLKMPSAYPEPNTILVNLAMNALTICIHEAGANRARTENLSAMVTIENEFRCSFAATEICNLIRGLGPSHVSTLNPVVIWCVRTASYTFLRTVKENRAPLTIEDHLPFLMSAMDVFKISNALTDIFINQTSADFEGLNIAQTLALNPAFS